MDRETSMGYGATTANYRLDHRSVPMIAGNDRLDSERDKLGMILGAEARIGVNTSTMPGVKIGANAIIGPSLKCKRRPGRRARSGREDLWTLSRWGWLCHPRPCALLFIFVRSGGSRPDFGSAARASAAWPGRASLRRKCCSLHPGARLAAAMRCRPGRNLSMFTSATLAASVLTLERGQTGRCWLVAIVLVHWRDGAPRDTLRRGRRARPGALEPPISPLMGAFKTMFGILARILDSRCGPCEQAGRGRRGRRRPHAPHGVRG